MSNDAGDKPPPKHPSQADLQKAAEAAIPAQYAAANIPARLNQLKDPKERERWMQEAYAKEIEKHGQSKMAKRLQSGTWQGAGGGAGIGGMVGVGVGTVTGTLVGTVAAIPTTLIGGGIGAGVGAVRGPFIKLGGKSKKEGDTSKGKGQCEQSSGPAVTKAKAQEVSEPATPGKPSMKGDSSSETQEAGQTTKPRKKPRKLQVRSQQARS